MTLQLGIKLSLDKGNVASGAEEAARSVEKIGTAARDVETAAGGMNKALTGAATTATTSSRATISAANDQVSVFSAATKATKEHGAALKLTGAQATQLSYQLNDVFVSLASGQNPMMVAIQQGSQITPIFGGLRGTFAALGSVLNPVTLSIAALAIGTGVAVKAGMDHAEAMRDAAIAANGLGRNIGTTSGEIEKISIASASAAGLSVTQARSIATELTKTGKIGTENFAGIIGVSKDFAKVLGTDVTSAASMLADIMADPAQGAEKLSKSLGLVDSATERLVKRLVDQNRISEAQTTLTAALQKSIGNASAATSDWAKAWENVARWASNAYNAIGAAVSGSKEGDTIESVQRQIAALQRLRQKATPGSVVQQDADEEIKRQQARLEELKAAQSKAEGDKAAAEADRAGRLGVDTARASSSTAITEALRYQRLKTEKDNLEAAAASPNLTAQEEAQIATALEAKNHALSTWISESERAAQLAQIDLAVMQARDPIERASLEAQRARIQARGQEMTETAAAAAVEQAYARALGETVAETRGSIVDITADAAARAKVNALIASGAIASGDAAREIQIETQTRQLLTAAARAEGAEKERLLGLASQLRSAIIAQAEAEKQAQALQDLQTGRDRIEQLQTELSLIGQAEPVRARALALLEAEQKIRNQGLSGPIADQIRAQARATADLTTALERQKSAWEEIQNTGGSAIDTIVEGFRTGKDVSQQLVDDLSKEFLKLAVSNPLKNAIFGQNLPTISDVGGLLGGLFGGKAGATAGIVPTSVATASINAGTVFVNGTGLAGATGLLGGATTSALPSGLPAIGTDGKVSEAYLKRLFTVESGNNPNAITGSNYGLAQFGYADIKQFGLSNPFDPAQARLATILEAQKNAPILSGILGRSVSPGELYLSHQQGLAGASALFKNPDMPAWQAIRPYYGSDAIAQKAITGNLGSVDMSSKQFTDMWVKKFEGGMDQAGEGLSQLSTKSVSATDALGQFTPATNQAVNALTNTSGGITQASNTLGSTITSTAATTQSAFGQLTSGLSSAFSSLFSGLGNILGGLGNGIGSLFSGLFSFDVGGWTGDGPVHAVSGVTHGQEFVVKAGPAARHRPILEAMNRGRALPGYAGGGWVGSPPARLANDDVVWMASAGRGVGGSGSARGGAAAAPVIQQTIVNQTSTASVTTREESDGKGGRRQVVLIEEAVGNALTRPRSASQKALKTAYGLQPRVTRR